ncbi:MAG: vitamin K epoxide reductase family protein [Candidatus Caldarchaeum sp.]|nr:vitamin K epoxide reductase family protein [Candidatus Caldarchaeum sp.]
MKLFYAAAAASTAGMVLSIYLTLLPPPQFCEISSFLSCETVLSSPYAYFLGLPTAAYGVVWFAVASSGVLLAADRKAVAKFMTIWSFFGVAAVAVLVYVEFFLIGSLCILCTVAHVLVFTVIAFYFYAKRRT